ncbi:hypothetical protein J7M23_06865 [Candidatus Sumerlaeota bacterium]|nr:hypothetical protein [Candidatus Sumerlaeota bacterium]
MKVVIRDGKVNGKKIIRAWESLHGWFWLATEKAENDLYFGFVIGICPEWGYFSGKELAEMSPIIWEVKPKDIYFIDREVET